MVLRNKKENNESNNISRKGLQEIHSSSFTSLKLSGSKVAFFYSHKSIIQYALYLLWLDIFIRP